MRLPHPLVIAALVMAMAGVAVATAVAADDKTPPDTRARELAYFVRQDCGSCHGMTLAGGLGPPLSPAALRGKSEAYLKLVILHGSGGTAMPGWASILSDGDAAWIAKQLLNGGIPNAR